MNIMQEQEHLFHSTRILCRYNRFTSRFQIFVDDELKFDRLLVLLGKTGQLSINGEKYDVEIRLLPLWRSRLTRQGEVIIDELLEARRRSSIVQVVGGAVFAGIRMIFRVFS